MMIKYLSIINSTSTTNRMDALQCFCAMCKVILCVCVCVQFLEVSFKEERPIVFLSFERIFIHHNKRTWVVEKNVLMGFRLHVSDNQSTAMKRKLKSLCHRYMMFVLSFYHQSLSFFFSRFVVCCLLFVVVLLSLLLINGSFINLRNSNFCHIQEAIGNSLK